MQSYYLKLRGFLKPTVLRLGMSEKRWREQVWADVADEAGGFDYYLPEGERSGQTLELYGRRLVLVTEPDRKRADTLFVSRASLRSPPDPPICHATAALALLTGPNAKVLSPVALLFASPSSVSVTGAARLPQAPWLGELAALDDDTLKLALSRHSNDLGALCDGGELEAAAWDELGRLLEPRAAFSDVLDGALATERPLRSVADWTNHLRPTLSMLPPRQAAILRGAELASLGQQVADDLAGDSAAVIRVDAADDASRRVGGEGADETALATLPPETGGAIVPNPEEPGLARGRSWRAPSLESSFPKLWAATAPAREVLKAAPQQIWARARRGIIAARLQPPALIAWPEGVHPDYARSHPVGVQRHVEAIIERLRSTRSSLAVIAPARSGKSTLAARLARSDRYPELAYGVLVSCAELDAARRDVGSVFLENLEEVLCRRFGQRKGESGPPRDLAAALEAARLAAASAGATCVVVVVDDADCLFVDASMRAEMQRVFRHALDYELGDSRAGRAAVAFVLIGTESLLAGMGVELTERLRPLQGGALTPGDVSKLVRTVAGGLWDIDPEAARILAQAAENLSFLREYLEVASRNAILRGGDMLTVGDVLEAQRWMLNELREGRAGAIEQRLVHSLAAQSGASPELGAARLAAAAAWAKARADGASTESALLTSTVARLCEWAEEACGDPLQRLAFDPDSVLIHVRELRERGLLGELDFVSDLRRAHLIRVADRPPLDDDWFCAGLRAVGSQQVVPPALLEPIALGDSAKVFRFSAGGERLAYREVCRAPELSSEDFEARLGALRVVQRASRARAPGSEYVFDLRAVGIRFDAADVAVQIYRWIDGEDLGSRVGGLAVTAVTQIGRCLARALDWLHGLGVLVFELRPEHVILEARHAHPVIIDLGFARLDAPPARLLSEPTSISGWSKSADIGALGALLESLLEPTASKGELGEVLARMRDDAHGERPTAAELVELFDAIHARTVLEQASRDSFRREVLDVARSDFRFAYYREVVQKFGPTFEASRLGLYPTALQRATRAADFLNQLLEAWSSERFGGGGRVALGTVKRRNQATGSRLAVPEIGFLHLLRTYRSHGGRGTLAEQVKSRYSHTSLAELRNMTLRGAELIAAELELGSLPQVVAAFFETGGRERH